MGGREVRTTEPVAAMTDDTPRPKGPAWRYFGGKWRARKMYPAPRYSTIVEPFAGAANYAWWHAYGRDVIIADRNEDVRNAWDLITSSDGPSIIKGAPDLVRGVRADAQSDDKRLVSLMCFWCSDGGAKYTKHPTPWALLPKKYGWNFGARERLVRSASNVISKPWVIFDDWKKLPDVEATWFIDPPYQVAGKAYKHGSRGIDYGEMADWCKSRRGQVIVCENMGADWLPFVSIGHVRSMTLKGSGARTSHEAVWSNDEQWMEELRRAAQP